MPTYAITAAAERLSPAVRAEIARTITTIHHEETGAPKYLAQVVFYDLGPSSHFIGGQHAAPHQIWVRGEIRAGRTDAQKGKILQRILEDVSRLTSAPREQVYVYLHDIPAQSVIEYGRPLTAPGDEAAWLATLPPALQERLRQIG
jgi:phenylpyruvate tautomerase PptA (4-oxalocrotonate tautomerase family)